MQPFMIHYTASKHAVTGMAQGVRRGTRQAQDPGEQPAPRTGELRMGTGDMMAAMGQVMESNPQLRTW